jgi:hypothetical protein
MLLSTLPALLLCLIPASASLRFRPHHQNVTKCPIIFDGRIPLNTTLLDFDNAQRSPFNAQYVKGENLTWSSIIDWPSSSYPPSRFNPPMSYKPFEVTIDDHSLFRTGQGLQLGFRRAGLLLKNDANAAGADAADKGIVTFHWSVEQDLAKPLNLTHEYMNVWHEKADYSGNQFTFGMGLLLTVDGGDGVNTRKKRESFKVQDNKNKIVFEVPIQWRGWQNFAIQLDYDKRFVFGHSWVWQAPITNVTNSTIQVFYSVGNRPLKAVTDALPNDNTGGGQMQLGMGKKPTETKTVVWDGYQEHLKRKEGQSYGGIFVEDSSNGCISL